jgi:hypothetical protein
VHDLADDKPVEASGLAPGGEVAGGLGVGFPGVGVADIGGEKFKDALRGVRVGSEEGWEWNARNYRRVISRLDDSGQEVGSHFFCRL